MLELQLLGAVTVRDRGVEADVPSVRQRAVLARLALAGGRPVARGDLITDLWGDRPPPSAVNAVQVVVSTLRKRFGTHLIVTSPAGYALDAEVGVDADRFESELQEGLAAAGTGDDLVATTSISRALGRWRGEPLSDLSAPFAARWRDVLRDRHAAAVECQAGCLTRLGRAAAAVELVRPEVAAHPYREGLAAALVVALAAAGRQADALDAYDTIRTHLVEDMGVDPGDELQRARLRVLQGDLPAQERRTATRIRFGPRELPQPMVGRDAELARLDAWLQQEDVRLLSIIGTGGVGKTRLAQALTAAHPDRTAFVSLANAQRPADVVPTICAALGIRPHADEAIASLADALHRAAPEPILVLDNFEQVLGAGPLVSELLAAVPSLKCVTTTRSPLRVHAERLVPLGPLSAAGSTSPAQVMLLERIRARDPAYRVEREDLRHLTDIARLCDGVPLALELAAARTNVLTLAELRDRIQASFEILAAEGGAGRHSSTNASIGWSTDGMTSAARAVLDAAAVFVGGFTKEDVGAVSGVPTTACENALGELLDRSLIQTEPVRDGRRFSLLAPIREVVAGSLTGTRRDRLRTAHSRRFAWLYCRHDFVDLFPSRAGDLQSVARDVGNIRTAILHARDAHPVDFAWMVARISRAWLLLGRDVELAEWRTAVLAEPSTSAEHRFDLLTAADRPSDDELAAAQTVAERMADPDRRRYLLVLLFNRAVEGLEVADARRLQVELGSALRSSGDPNAATAMEQAEAMVAILEADYPRALAILESSRARSSRPQFELAALNLDRSIAEVQLMTGAFDASARLALDVLTRTPEPERRARASALSIRGVALLGTGEVLSARQCLHDALALLAPLEWNPENLEVLLRWAAAEAAAAPGSVASMTAYGVWRAAKAVLGVPPWPIEAALVERYLAGVDDSPGQQATARDAGAAMVRDVGVSAATGRAIEDALRAPAASGD